MHKRVKGSRIAGELSETLLVLLARLATEGEEARVIQRFRETVNSVYGRELMGEFRDHPGGPCVALATARTRFGGYPLREDEGTVPPETLAILQAAAGSVALMLEALHVRRQAGEREYRLERDIEVATRELAAQAETYRGILDSLREAVYLWERGSDGTLRCIEANAAAARMLGYGREELVGLRPEDLTGDPERGSIADCMLDLRGKSRRVFSTIHVARDGSEVPVEVEVCALHTGGASFLLSRALRATG